MMTTSFLDLIPLWALYPLTFLLMFAAFEGGFRYGGSWQKKNDVNVESSAGAMAGATLGLLAFLLAFIISLATARYDNRRQLVLDEANAVRTAYLQAGYLPDPYPAEFRDMFREYVDLRLAPFQGDDITMDELIPMSEEKLGEIWRKVETVVKENPGRDEISAFIVSVNEIVNVHARRAMAALYSRLPPTIMLGMYLVAALTMAMTGFQISYSPKRNLFSIIVMIAIFTIVIMLIIDLDRPQEGFLQVSQQALIDLQRQIAP